MTRRFQVVTAAKAPQGMQRAAVAARTGQPRGRRAGDMLLALQRTHGNRYVQRLVSQARATPAGDRYEREADQVARQVAQGFAATVRDRHGGAGQADVGMRHAIQAGRGRGQALPAGLRARMEQALGHDFGGVRLHNDAQSDQLNRVLGARAFTTGRDVYLRRGEADVATRAGGELIAHELTHVVQQAGGEQAVQCKLLPILSDPDHLWDNQTGVRARLKTGTTGIYIGDTNGKEYKIGIAGNGEETFVLNTPVITPVPQTTPQPPTTLAPPPTPTVQQTTPPPPPPPQPMLLTPTVQQTTPLPQPTTAPPTSGLPTTAPPTSGLPTLPPPIQIPPWNPPPISNLWTSPSGGTTYSFSPVGYHPYRKGDPAGKFAQDNRRTAGGLVNPPQSHKNMLPHFRKAALSPVPSTVTDDSSLRKWVMDPDRRLEVTSPGKVRKKVIKGYKDGGTKSAVVLGHEPSAGTYFNSTGHTLPRGQNLVHNRSTGAYHGLEDALWSAQSGAKEPRYSSPRPDRGSHPSYYDSTRTTDFTGGPWPTYTPVADQPMIDYIEGKLNAVSTTAASDPDYVSAVDQLSKLKTTYSISAARGLLAMIGQKGW